MVGIDDLYYCYTHAHNCLMALFVFVNFILFNFVQTLPTFEHFILTEAM